MTYNMMNNSSLSHHQSDQNRPVCASRRGRGGFTLIEVMVALAILMVMLVIMFVPINLGVSVTQIGRTRADVQQTSQLTLNRLEAELRQAMIVFPNDAMPGITDKTPYNNTGINRPLPPYYRLNNVEAVNEAFIASPGYGACSSSGVERVSNTSRIDFILPKRGADGQVITPLVPDDYLITYYARRLNVDGQYDPTLNPVELFRAETWIGDSTGFIVNSSRYPSSECASDSVSINKRTLWMCESKYGEPNLNITGAFGLNGSHTLMTPRDMGLIAPLASPNSLASPTPTPDYTPSTSFICQDSDSDGKIDRVKISLTLAKFDANGSSSAEQRIPLNTIVTLPNVR